MMKSKIKLKEKFFLRGVEDIKTTVHIYKSHEKAPLLSILPDICNKLKIHYLSIENSRSVIFIKQILLKKKKIQRANYEHNG